MAARNSRETSVNVARAKYAGVLSILQYNWHFYAASLCALVGIGALLWFRLLPRAGEALLIGAATLTAFWSLSSLLVSYYVYDNRGVTRWNWIPGILSFPPQRWLNIHAGLDESTLILTQFFPNTRYMVVDIYDPQEMTEPSIARARRMHPSPEPAVVGQTGRTALTRSRPRYIVSALCCARNPSICSPHGIFPGVCACFG